MKLITPIYPEIAAHSSIVAMVYRDLRKNANLQTPLVLTGSRFFGNVTASSDWDFFTEYDESLISPLMSSDWEIAPSAYRDDSIIWVLSKTFRIDRISIKVDLQLVRKPHVKYAAQLELKKNDDFVNKLLDDDSVRRLWDSEIKAQARLMGEMI